LLTIVIYEHQQQSWSCENLTGMFVIKWWLDKIAAHFMLIWDKSIKSLNL